MVGITCALFDEGFEIIRRLAPAKINGVAHYTGKICGRDVSLFLTRPGIKNNRKKLEQWLRLYHFSFLVNTGFCGALTNRYAPGDVCEIGEAVAPGQIASWRTSSPADAQKIITVDHPVISMEEREEVLLKYNAALVDMESYWICEIFNEILPDASWRIIRVVGDVPGEDDLMQHEIKMRSFFSTFSIISKMRIALQTGLPFFRIYKRKRRLQILLHRAVCEALSSESKPPAWTLQKMSGSQQNKAAEA